jgi:hypothetical protein
VTNAQKSIVSTVHIDDARRGGTTRAREALRRHVGGTFFGSGLNTTDGAARFAAEIVRTAQ